ncbi:uncharacterized protein BX663DRAFT_10392 [Cokeromyces recurvatus]|uniref:uncharacterized protein n=1 Tax=Cokeromyces recurvatus TaxID=90255 RepID=UPI002220E35F|nr:uncharacterized protein BX663DRAFT_10392 [Cokeromyces recurvatus]KAI7907758.1 hypothetical protein BX663DRAFT_10392 [Cokeromyces recurvatus]
MNTMFAGISDYGISANKDKCMSNLIIDIEEFPWLGFKLNTKTLDISIDTTKRKRLDVLSSLTVQYSCQPSKTLLNSGVR